MKKRRRKHNTHKKIFKTIFVGTYVSFICFLYLFATRVTPWDINYFIKETQKHTTALVTTLKTQKAAFDAKREAAALAKAISAKKDKTSEKKSSTKDIKKDTDETVLQSDTIELIYYSQNDPRWKTAIYGGDNIIGVFGCGPTTLAMIVSTLTDNQITPDVVAKWAYDNGHFCNNSGSYHSIIPKGVENYGLTSESLKDPSKETIFQELSNGNLVVVLMNKGIFTSQGHFIVLRGVTTDGKVLIADSQSPENSEQAWDIETILKEAKYTASYGGPFWSISRSSS
ncbi:C39 family peptidase [Anaerotignum sp.]|uniref:C39 family peptidase n=1 Tax=Anaerotignum sp. TaxID=2039241 RepID=UPI002714C5AE|nr:C39 family peptidase [Anaerotignum sp.]